MNCLKEKNALKSGGLCQNAKIIPKKYQISKGWFPGKLIHTTFPQSYPATTLGVVQRPPNCPDCANLANVWDGGGLGVICRG